MIQTRTLEAPTDSFSRFMDSSYKTRCPIDWSWYGETIAVKVSSRVFTLTELSRVVFQVSTMLEVNDTVVSYPESFWILADSTFCQLQASQESGSQLVVVGLADPKILGTMRWSCGFWVMSACQCPSLPYPKKVFGTLGTLVTSVSKLTSSASVSNIVEVWSST